MGTLTLEELKLELRDANLPENFAYEIIKQRGNNNKTINKTVVKNIIENLLKAFSYTGKYEPKSLFSDTTFTPDELSIYVDNRFSYLKRKYGPYGLRVPFSSWEEARKWIIKESLEGVLTTSRIGMPTVEEKPLSSDTDIYMCYLIKMPYERATGNQGRNGINHLICNFSPFLLELHHTIDSLNDCTGIDSIELLRYFLCGNKPDFSRISVLSYNFLHQFLKIQINTADVTRNEWLEIYNLYRKENNRKHKKQPSKRMIKFSKLLETMEIPEKPDAEFYRMLMQKWNKETGENVKEWRNIRQMHERTIQRIEDISPLKETLLNITNQKEDK